MVCNHNRNHNLNFENNRNYNRNWCLCNRPMSDLEIEQSVPVRCQVVLHTEHGSWKAKASAQEDEEHQVGGDGRDVHDLARRLDPTTQADEDNEPGAHQTQQQLPADSAPVLDTISHLQHIKAETITWNVIRSLPINSNYLFP